MLTNRPSTKNLCRCRQTSLSELQKLSRPPTSSMLQNLHQVRASLVRRILYCSVYRRCSGNGAPKVYGLDIISEAAKYGFHLVFEFRWDPTRLFPATWLTATPHPRRRNAKRFSSSQNQKRISMAKDPAAHRPILPPVEPHLEPYFL